MWRKYITQLEVKQIGVAYRKDYPNACFAHISKYLHHSVMT